MLESMIFCTCQNHRFWYLPLKPSEGAFAQILGPPLITLIMHSCSDSNHPVQLFLIF